MKVNELTEQLQRRKSPEELAAMKAAPGYWRGVLRKEFNALVRKYGGTVIKAGPMGDNDDVAHMGGDIFVMADGESHLLGRDHRARGLVHAVARLIERLAKEGYVVGVARWSRPYSMAKVTHDTPRHQIEMEVRDAARVEDSINYLQATTNLGHKRPVVFNLRLVVAKRPRDLE